MGHGGSWGREMGGKGSSWHQRRLMTLLAAEEAHPRHDQLHYLVPRHNLTLQKGKQLIAIFLCASHTFFLFFWWWCILVCLFFSFVLKNSKNEIEFFFLWGYFYVFFFIDYLVEWFCDDDKDARLFFLSFVLKIKIKTHKRDWINFFLAILFFFPLNFYGRIFCIFSDISSTYNIPFFVALFQRYGAFNSL